MKVLMAEDLESVREHLSRLMAEVEGIELRFLRQDAAPLLQTTADWQPEALIIDIRMRGMMMIGILGECKKRWPSMAIVVSGFAFEPYYRSAFLKNGADYAFDKTVEWSELIAFLVSLQGPAASIRADVPLMAPAQIDAARSSQNE